MPSGTNIKSVHAILTTILLFHAAFVMSTTASHDAQQSQDAS